MPEASTAKDPGWGFWFTLCSACIVGVLVNQLEGPFARSIVACDTPVNTTVGAEKALSNRCGDRLYVIGEGARLSAKGQSLENFCKILMALLLGNLVNIFGRKPMMILAIGSMWLSVLLFVAASVIPPLSATCFIIAQGIQGMATGDMLANIVFADLAAAAGASGADILVKKDQILGGTMFLCFWLAQLIASFELTEYLIMWLAISVVITFAMYACLMKFPETMVKKSDDDAKLSFGEKLMEELSLYKRMFVEKKIVCWCMIDAFLSGLGQDSRAGFWAPFMMVCYGYTQQQIVVRLLPFTILAGITGPWVNNYCKKVGFTKGMWRAVVTVKTFGWTLMPLCVTCWWMPWFTKACYMPLGGYGSVFLHVRNKMVGEKMMPKMESMQFLNYFAAQAIGSNVHWVMFNERAKTIWEKFISHQMFTSSLNLLDWIICLFIMYPCIRPVLESMDAEMAAYTVKKDDSVTKDDSAGEAKEGNDDSKKNEESKKDD